MPNVELTAELLQDVAKLPKGTRVKVLQLIGQSEFEKCADDPLYWLDATKHVPTPKYPTGIPYVFTWDPHKVYECSLCQGEVYEEKRADHMEFLHEEPNCTLHRMREVFSPFPAVRPLTLMEYMSPIVKEWLTSQFFAIEKSRDMMATWLMVCCFTWDAMFHNGVQHIFQSEDAFKTLELVQRANIIYENTPNFLKLAIGRGEFNKGATKSGEMYFRERKSEILGLPQGPSQIRQFHPSGVFSDEAAFQNEAGATFAAIKPAILMGGRYTAISSANRGWFELVCRDRTDE